MSRTLAKSYLRLVRSWLLLPVVAYLLAIPFLGPGALFVPIVIANAPLGIISWFTEVSLDSHLESPITKVLNLFFWIALLLGSINCKTFPLPVLRSIWWLLVFMLIASVSGCAVQFGAGLRSPGTWH